jgi:YbgC/YbaW family acyl-CoA thioester hydrolase
VSEFRFTMRSRVDFSDTDVTGVVYYGRYPVFFDRAVVAYRRALGIDLLGPDGHHYLIRAVAAQYHGSLRFDDEIDVHVRISTIGRTSHSYDIRIERVDGGQRVHCVDGQITIVGVGGYGPDAVPSPMPEGLRRTIQEFEGIE